MMQTLKNKRAEAYIDVAITIMIVAFVMIFSVNMVSLVALSQNLKIISDQLVEYAAMNGTTDVSEYANILQEQSNIDYSYTFAGTTYVDGSSKVQLGDRITCTVSCSKTVVGFGDFYHSMIIKASSSGISRVYTK